MTTLCPDVTTAVMRMCAKNCNVKERRRPALGSAAVVSQARLSKDGPTPSDPLVKVGGRGHHDGPSNRPQYNDDVSCSNTTAAEGQ